MPRRGRSGSFGSNPEVIFLRPSRRQQLSGRRQRTTAASVPVEPFYSAGGIRSQDHVNLLVHRRFSFERAAVAPGEAVNRLYPAPVSAFVALVGFDSGEPLCRSTIESTTRTAVDRNSDCQF
jgi:hypothetical protein